MDDDKPLDRRRFFRKGLSELLRPIASAIGPLERVAHKLGELETIVHNHNQQHAPQQSKLPPQFWLRPPGAAKESQINQLCTRGGECVQACPAKCIKIDPTGLNGDGLPYIDADTSACVVCDGLYCMHVCPSGALVPTSINDIDMGTAVWKEETCLRSSGRDCRICVDECPLGEMAIKLKDGLVAVNPLGCIGCGICQQECPTNPKSIGVIPKMAKER
jgi:ferredoxin-type protein NapG